MRFMSQTKHFSITMKPPVKTIINGEVVNDPGKTLFFKNHLYVTDDKSEIEFLEGQLKKGNTRFFKIDEEKLKKAAEFGKRVDALKKEMGLDEETEEMLEKTEKTERVARGLASSEKGLYRGAQKK